MKIAAVVVVILVVAFLIPVDQWDSRIASGRYISEATITKVDSNAIVARIDGTSTYLQLKGSVPAGVDVGRAIMIGYSAQGLYENMSQKVEVACYVKGNALSVLVNTTLRSIFPHYRVNPTTMQVADVQSDGTRLKYHVAA